MKIPLNRLKQALRWQFGDGHVMQWHSIIVGPGALLLDLFSFTTIVVPISYSISGAPMAVQ